MRVGIDYHPAVTHPPGVGRYLRELVRALARSADRPQLALLDVGRGPRGFTPGELGFQIGDPRVARVTDDASPRLARFVDRLRRRGADERLGGVDVFHHARPGTWRVRRARGSIAVAELPPRGDAREEPLRAALTRLDHVFAFSGAYRSRLVSEYRLDPARVVQVPVGCEHWRRSLAAFAPCDPPRRIVVLGAPRAARRPLPILRAFERLVEGGADVELEFLARPGSGRAADPTIAAFASAVAASPQRARVHLPEARAAAAFDPFEFERGLPARVAGAAALVHLSVDEGTPVTPLEALCLGVPVVVSRIPAFEEALRGVATLVEDAEIVREPRTLAEALARAIETRDDPVRRADAELRCRDYTWDLCAARTLAAWAGR